MTPMGDDDGDVPPLSRKERDRPVRLPAKLLTAVLLLTALLAGCTAGAPADPNCPASAERKVTIPASDVKGVSIMTAGRLEVEGKPGLTDVRVTARVCAPDKASLQAVNVKGQESNDRYARVEVERPEGSPATVTLVVEVPGPLDVQIKNTNGDVTVRNVGANLVLANGPGQITLNGVGGTVTVEDGEGDIHASTVGGNFSVVRDAAGTITLKAIGGNVLISTHQGGDMEITDVGGNLMVLDSSGAVRHSGVQGTVTGAK
jgi:hypothetical protein